MIRTINPYGSARTAEILSRYRPIAPKPETPAGGSTPENENSAMPQSIRKSPYLRNVWAHLQARPTRTRKRGRTTAFSPPSVRRTRTCLQGLSPPYSPPGAGTRNPAMHGFSHTGDGLAPPQISLVPLKCGLDTAVTTLAETVALPLLRYPTQLPILIAENCRKSLDLNANVDQRPQELDFMPQLREPVKPSVISPRPVRPVGSTIVVRSLIRKTVTLATGPKKAEEVEKEAEAEAVPVVISDSRNRVRLTNSAYKEMVGQPECCWLDACGGACKRIGGEVALRFEEWRPEMPVHGFRCRVRIEWESNGKKSCVEGLCKGEKLDCDGKDYQILWRFNMNEGFMVLDSCN
ncbi:hypothetical protein CDL12_22311 [Handroanthus impetiginosus]|uniref:DUF7950 domain-containing protein n=1 Tax=Handroanthus impetiginosus TaxID=429701 RepID=A0A2G9GIN0_9LAMI|nr:hypothetical protein CDL12_22311 [Handroanthus impetiginosus]